MGRSGLDIIILASELSLSRALRLFFKRGGGFPTKEVFDNCDGSDELPSVGEEGVVLSHHGALG